MKVLIVDDNAYDRKLLRYNLERHGCRVEGTTFTVTLPAGGDEV